MNVIIMTFILNNVIIITYTFHYLLLNIVTNKAKFEI